jgi:hypothetical protein
MAESRGSIGGGDFSPLNRAVHGSRLKPHTHTVTCGLEGCGRRASRDESRSEPGS